MKSLRFVGAMLLGIALWPALALAAETTSISVPVGSWISEAGIFIGPLLAAAALWLVRKLPAQIASILIAARVDQLLQKAIDYAINSVAGAAKDKALSVDVGSAVVAQAVQYAIDHGPGWMIGWMGGADMIREKIIARLNVDAAAALK